MYDVRWVHMFEEDGPGALVYRKETDNIPLSRRPRDGFELHRDGSARLFEAGPDDRALPQAATWSDTPDGLVVRDAQGGVRFRIVTRTPSRLTVSRE
jgi:hypothetical protein